MCGTGSRVSADRGSLKPTPSKHGTGAEWLVLRYCLAISAVRTPYCSLLFFGRPLITKNLALDR